jgi:hypothetical protein
MGQQAADGVGQLDLATHTGRLVADFLEDARRQM